MTNIIFDTDPGVDDAMALLFALRCPEITVVGVTTVYGNVSTDLTTANALRLVELAGRADIPVARGAARPLVQHFDQGSPYVHGDDGLGNIDAPPPLGAPIATPAAQFIVDTVLARPGEITLVAVGPLTNLALALRLAPEIVGAVRAVIVMGGAAFVPGNVSPVAEANIHNDPHAAEIVLTAGWPLTLVGLDVTMQVLMDQAYIDALATANNPSTNFIARITAHYFAFHERVAGFYGAYTHDPSAIAYAVDPTLFTTQTYAVRVALEGLATGQVIVDRQRRWFNTPPIAICTSVDSARLLALFHQRLTQA